MGTPYTFDKGMSCHSTSIELLYFDDNFCRIALWVLALSHALLFRPCCAALSMLCSFSMLICFGILCSFDGAESVWFLRLATFGHTLFV